ncbi:hypothetical protein ACWD4J_14620 [Streptomyces sp. NPDC002577]
MSASGHQPGADTAAHGHEFSADDLAELDEISPPLPPIALF